MITDDILDAAHQLRSAFMIHTSQLPERWSEANPSTGHCAVVAVILQSLYGGEVVRGVSSQGIVHYWNRIDGVTVDVTRDQFEDGETFTEIQVDPPAEVYLTADLPAKIVHLLERTWRR